MVYRKTIHDLQKVTGEPVKVVHIFGGGIQNQLLVQLTADLTQLPVVAGPVEASVLGNIVSQLLVLKQTTPDHVVNIMNHSYAVKTYRPSRVESFENRLKKFEMLLKQEQDLDWGDWGWILRNRYYSQQRNRLFIFLPFLADLRDYCMVTTQGRSHLPCHP